MSTFIRCDGCGTELCGERLSVVIHGGRANGMGGGWPIPDGEFDWCEACSLTAFKAVAATGVTTP